MMPADAGARAGQGRRDGEGGLGPGAVELVDVARRHLGHLSDDKHEAMLGAIRARLAVHRRSRVVRAALFAATAAAIAASAGVIAWHRPGPAAISYRVEGSEAKAGGLVDAPAATHPVLRFSDGSEVTLTEGARAHVRGLDEHGARLTLDEGQAHAYIVHAPGARWTFDAGPYAIAVRGTAFGLAWTASQGRLDVRLENGSVAVSGPVFDSPLLLQAGQWLTVRGRSVLLRDLGSPEPEPSSVASAGPSPAESSPPASSSESAPPDEARGPRGDAHAHAAGPLGHGWAAALAEGRFTSILDQAQRLGLDVAFATSSREDLAALADAARYLRRYDTARGTLLAVRRRFPATVQSRAAGFSLGRLAETQGDPRGALVWFETYLVEAPEGTYASEALGRKMLLVEERQGRKAARPLAEAYLLRFPTGTYAEAARALNREP